MTYMKLSAVVMSGAASPPGAKVARTARRGRSFMKQVEMRIFRTLSALEHLEDWPGSGFGSKTAHGFYTLYRSIFAESTDK